MKRSILNLLAIAASTTLLAASAFADGSITVKGSDTMVLLGQKWAETYMKKSPAVQIQVTGGGSGTGIAALINGTTDIAESSRAMKPTEITSAESKQGAKVKEIPVALDALSIYVNAANPLTIGNQVLVTECYGPGAALLDLSSGKPKEVWTDLEKEKFDKALMCHWNTPIHHAGFVYGSSGRHDNEAELRCVELKTGDIKWRVKRTFRTSLLMVDGHLVNLSEYGDLSLIKLNSEKYEEVSKYAVPELSYPCWAPPVLSGGLLYVRGKGRLVCLELIPEKK